MQGLLRVALMSALGLTLWGCSTAPSQPVTVRNVTAVCPPPTVMIDRSFAAHPPRCVETIPPFRFDPEGKWIEALADSAGEIKTQSECLGLVASWLAEERTAREAPAS